MTSTTKTMEFKSERASFTIIAPKTWIYSKSQGIDSYVGKIYIGQSDTIYFDLGYFSSGLDHPFCIRGDINDALVKTKKTCKSINGLNAKIVLHKYQDKNDFGIHFDSIWTENRNEELKSKDIVRFTVYGINISKEGQKQMRKTFETIKFFKSE